MQWDFLRSATANEWPSWAQPAVTSVILGVRNTDQLADNLGATSVELTADELKRLDEVSAPVVSDYPYGEAGTDQRHRAIDVSD